MAKVPSNTYGFPPEAFDPKGLPDYYTEFTDDADIEAFAAALHAPDPLQSPVEDTTTLRSPGAWSFSTFNVTKRNSIIPHTEESEASQVAASAAAQAGDVVAPGLAAPSQNGPLPGGHPPPPITTSQSNMFITAQNDWAPVNERIHRKRSRSRSKAGNKRRNGRAKDAAQALLGTRTKDETREGYLYVLLKWPMLFFVGAWLLGLALTYLYTRLYIWVYEHFVTWRGRRQQLRMEMRKTSTYRDWIAAARELDDFLGRQRWKEENDFAYYDSKTVRRVWEQLRKCRQRAEAAEGGAQEDDDGEIDRVKGKRRGEEKGGVKAVEELRVLLQACVKSNFVGVENPRLYSQTYYGTKNLVQNFVDESESSLLFPMGSSMVAD